MKADGKNRSPKKGKDIAVKYSEHFPDYGIANIPGCHTSSNPIPYVAGSLLFVLSFIVLLIVNIRKYPKKIEILSSGSIIDPESVDFKEVTKRGDSGKYTLYKFVIQYINLLKEEKTIEFTLTTEKEALKMKDALPAILSNYWLSTWLFNVICDIFRKTIMIKYSSQNLRNLPIPRKVTLLGKLFILFNPKNVVPLIL